MPPEHWTFYGVVFIAFGVLMAVFMGGMALYYTNRARAVYSWRVVPGKILSSEVRRRSTKNGGYTHVPIVHYEYEVGGRVYLSKTLSRDLKRGWAEASEAQARIAAYPAGMWVDVHYDPQRPDQSVLEVVMPKLWWMYLVGGMTLCLSLTGGAIFLARGLGLIFR